MGNQKGRVRSNSSRQARSIREKLQVCNKNSNLPVSFSDISFISSHSFLIIFLFLMLGWRDRHIGGLSKTAEINSSLVNIIHVLVNAAEIANWFLNPARTVANNAASSAPRPAVLSVAAHGRSAAPRLYLLLFP